MSTEPKSSIHKNPFWVLGVTVRDNRHLIMERAEERALSADPVECQKARSDLTNPRARLSAEVAWLPGVSPRMAEKLVESLERDPLEIGNQTGIPEISRANLMAAALELTDPSESDASALADFMQALGEVVDSIEPDTILRDVNEDRAVAGFPEMRDIGAVEEELELRRRHYKSVLKNSLDGMPSAMLVETMTTLVDQSTASGSCSAPSLVDDLVDSYELETHAILEKESENIRKLIQSALAAAPSGARSVDPILTKLDQVIRSWCRISHPIQMSMKARGIDQGQSERLAYDIRSMGIDLYNKHDLLAQAERVTRLIQELFNSLPELAEKAQSDAQALRKLAKDSKAAEERDAEWRQSITYHAQVGLVLKDDLGISPSGITWKNRTIPLEAVNTVRWGGVSHSVNGIPTGTDFTVAISDGRTNFDISLRNKTTYTNFTACLWRAVCVRLLIETVKQLKEGGTLAYGSFQVADSRVRLTRHKLFGNEEVWLNLNQIHIWSGGGEFYIGDKSDKKVYGSASYISHRNTHIIEALIRGSFKDIGSGKFSGYWEK